MKFVAPILVSGLFLLAGCSSPREAISPSKGDSPTKRCAAINSQFAKGTPMSQIEAKVGRPDTMIITTSLSWPAETQNQRIWVYHFDSEDILISSTGEPTTPLGQRGFDGARVVKKTK